LPRENLGENGGKADGKSPGMETTWMLKVQARTTQIYGEPMEFTASSAWLKN